MATDLADSPSGTRSNYRFLLSPKWIAFHLLVIVVVVAMVNLAFWQLRRLHERRDFNAEVRANSSQPVVPLDDLRTGIDQQAPVEWRRVDAAGSYVPGKQFTVVNRSQGGEPGQNVVDALKLDDGSLVLVNRGFVSQDHPVPAAPTGPVHVIGRLRNSEHRRTGQQSDVGSDRLTEIRRVDIDVLRQQFDDNVLPMYIEQLEATPADAASLEPISPPALDEGPHLSYTIQWFIFSVCVLIGWVLAVRRSAAIRSGKPVKLRKSSYIPIAEDESIP
jgi:cytochrome oxidase assembly protein ShyY1